MYQGWRHVNLFPLTTTEVFMRRLEAAKAFVEEDRQLAAVEMADSPQAQLVKQRSDETGKGYFEVALELLRENNASINAASSVADRAAA